MANTPSSIDTFRRNFSGGNRTHRYNVTMDFPSGVGPDRDLNQFFVRAVSLPPSQVNPIRVPYRGRILKWPGDRVYFPWTIRILDEGGSGSLWEGFQQWSRKINDHDSNISNDNWSSWTTDWKVHQEDVTGRTVKTVTLHDVWPTVVGPITLDSNSIDTLVEFTVTVEYQWFTLGSGGSGSIDDTGDEPVPPDAEPPDVG